MLWAFVSNLPKPLTKYGYVMSSWLQIRKIFIFRLYQVFGKVTKFGGNWLKNKNVTGKRHIGRRKMPPSPTVLKMLAFVSHCSAKFQLISDCFIPNFKLKYQNSENIKSGRVYTVAFNLHPIKRQTIFGDTWYI